MHRLLASLCVFVSAAAHAAVGEGWLTRAASPTSATLRAVASTGSAFIAAGKDGAALRSADGSTWSVSATGTQANLNAVASSGSLSVMAGDEGVVLTSSDGIAWTLQRSIVMSDWRAAVWTGSTFVVVGDAGSIATSADGVNWACRYIGSMADLKCVAAGGSLVVVGGNNGFIAWSTDLTNWNTASSGTTASVRCIATNGSLWAAATDNGVMLSTSNVATWSGVNTNVGVSLNNVLWTGSAFVASGTDGACVTSSDASTWTIRSSGTAGELLGGAVVGGTVAVVGEFGVIVTSANITTWTVRSSGTRESVHDIASTGARWAAVGEGGSVSTSPAGDSWSAETSNVTGNLHGVAWNGSKLVAVGDAGTIIRSNDGMAWITSSSPTTRSLRAVAASPSLFVAVGEAGVMFSSGDGASWSSVASITTSTWRDIVWSGTQFVAVGDNGVLGTSSNGTSWTARSSGVSLALASVAWSGSSFVAVGASGTIIRSSNGISWTASTLPLSDTAFAHFRSVCWDGVEFVAVGDYGSPVSPKAMILTSFDGSNWMQRSIEAAPPLNAVFAVSAEIFVAGLGGALLQNLQSPPPELSFDIDQSSFAESAGTVTVTLRLSAVSLIPIKANFTTSGTAALGATGDATISASPVTIAPGQTSGTITVTIREDTVDEPDETILFTLVSSSGAMLAAPLAHTLTIIDNDLPPSIGTQPTSRVVPTGTALTMDTSVTGDAPLTLQWTKNTVAIAGATAPSYLIASAGLTSAGTYQLKATNKVGSATSNPAELVVVDTINKTYNIVYKNSVTFTIGAGGNNLSYQWKHDGNDVTDDTSTAKRITGSTTKTLIIKNLGSADSGVYRCLVTSPVGSLSGGENALNVIIPPVVNPPVFPTLMVSQALSQQVTAQNAPTKITITGLPAGLTYNATTGLVSGRPLVASGANPFTITIVASNEAGSSSPPTTMPLTVLPLAAGISGAFAGLIDRDASLNATLGGRLQFIVSKTGVVTGSVLNGKTTSAFVKALDTVPSGNPTLTATMKRTAKPNLDVQATLDIANGLFTGTLSDTTGSATFTAWKSMAAPFTGFPGRYTAAFKLASSSDEGVEAIPQGYGYTIFTLATNGVASGAVRVADGTQFSFSTSLRNIGELALYTPLYLAPGSFHGRFVLTPGSPALLTTTGLTWYKPAQTSGRSYRAGFGPLSLTGFGAVYTPPPVGTILAGLPASADNVPNAALTFAEGGAPDPATRLNIQFRLTAPGVRDPQTPASNPGKVTMTINPLLGYFTGGFSLTDLATGATPNVTVTRSVPYYSIIVRDPTDGLLRSFGHFQLPKLPDSNAVPPTTPTTSPLLSGKVMLDRVP